VFEALVGISLIIGTCGVILYLMQPNSEEKMQDKNLGIGGVDLQDESYWRYEDRRY
jgi:hypothetical protein